MKTVLVVDDDETVLQAVSDILGEEDYTVITAADGKSGLIRNREYTPDAILTDIVMPDMEGIEFIRTVRKERKDVPIIVMSGNPVGMKFFKVAGLLGATKNLLKPFSRQDLFTALSEVLHYTP